MINWLWILFILSAPAPSGQSDGVQLRHALSELLEVSFLDQQSCALVVLIPSEPASLWRCGSSRKIGPHDVALESVTQRRLTFRVGATSTGALNDRMLVEIDGRQPPRITVVTQNRPRRARGHDRTVLGAPDARPP